LSAIEVDGDTLGKLIVICGIDGSGKSTQETLLAKSVRGAGHDVTCTRQPSEWYRKLPEVRTYLDTGQSALSPTAIALLSAADRMMHIDTVILPAVRCGVHVICNRYVYSSFGYFKARGIDPEFVANINAAVPEPDMGVLLKIDPSVAVRRVSERGEDRKFEEKSADYLESVQQEMLRVWPDRFLVVDAEQPVGEIADQIASYVMQSLQARVAA
jgi:dTMP kinase